MNDVKDLIAEARERFHSASSSAISRSEMAGPAMILVAGFVPRLADALEAQQARIAELEAQYASHRDVLIERRDEWMHRAVAAEAVRDALAAAIEEVHEWHNDIHARTIRQSDIDNLHRLLGAVPAELLREHDANVWGKARAVIDGLHPRCTEQCDMCAELDLWLSAFDDANPYRVKPEGER